MVDISKKLETPGPWQVIREEFPHQFGGVHVQNRIFTKWDHPQLNGPVGVVNLSIGVGEKKDGPARPMVELSDADARRIVACVNACAGLSTELLESILLVGDTLLGRFEALNDSD